MARTKSGTPADAPSPYRGSIKHKRRPGRGRKGTICPEWTHAATEQGLGVDAQDHAWSSTVAHRLFQRAVIDPGTGRRFNTERGIAFEAKSTGDGTWHGYPVPWNAIPAGIKDAWVATGVVTTGDLDRYFERPAQEIYWAWEADRDG